jgi:hypothetical protein
MLYLMHTMRMHEYTHANSWIYLETLNDLGFMKKNDPKNADLTNKTQAELAKLL